MVVTTSATAATPLADPNQPAESAATAAARLVRRGGPAPKRAAESRRSGSDSSEVEHEREDEDDCPGPDGIHDEVTGLPVFQAGERHAATQEAEEKPC